MISRTLLALAGLIVAPPSAPFDPDDYRLVEVGTFQQPSPEAKGLSVGIA